MTHRVDTEDKMENVINESLTSPRWRAPYAGQSGEEVLDKPLKR
jgi:hypothetical protein